MKCEDQGQHILFFSSEEETFDVRNYYRRGNIREERLLSLNYTKPTGKSA